MRVKLNLDVRGLTCTLRSCLRGVEAVGSVLLHKCQTDDMQSFGNRGELLRDVRWAMLNRLEAQGASMRRCRHAQCRPRRSATGRGRRRRLQPRWRFSAPGGRRRCPCAAVTVWAVIRPRNREAQLHRSDSREPRGRARARAGHTAAAGGGQMPDGSRRPTASIWRAQCSVSGRVGECAGACVLAS
jgi:hypothetical protein